MTKNIWAGLIALVLEHVKVKNVILLAIDENNRMTLQKRNGPIYYKNVEVERR